MSTVILSKEKYDLKTKVKKDNWISPKSDITKHDEVGLDYDSNTKDVAKVAATLKALQFTDNTTMHGLRYIFLRDISIVKRLFWLSVVLAGMTYCSYVFYKTFASYLAYPTVMKISTKFERGSKFPAITICNYNTFQKSKLIDEEEKALSIVFGEGAFDWIKDVDVQEIFEGINLTEFYMKTAFDYDFQPCTYKAKACRKELFTKVLTDFGVCVKFDPSGNTTTIRQTTAGPKGGLYLGTSFHADEWTVGHHFQNQGFRIAIHEPGTNVYTLQSNGFSVQAGLTTNLIIQRKKAKYLTPPYGQCGDKALKYFPRYSRQLCLLECETLHTVAICGCKLVYMPGPSSVCTFFELEDCLYKLINDWEEENIFDASNCSCPQDCDFIKYEAQITLADTAMGFSRIINNSFGYELSDGFDMNVYYQDLMVTEEVEEPVYSVEKLLCDVGGAAGLFLGCSFVTIVEIIDFLGELAWFGALKGFLMKQRKPAHEAPV